MLPDDKAQDVMAGAFVCHRWDWRVDAQEPWMPRLRQAPRRPGSAGQPLLASLCLLRQAAWWLRWREQTCVRL